LAENTNYIKISSQEDVCNFDRAVVVDKIGADLGNLQWLFEGFDRWFC